MNNIFESCDNNDEDINHKVTYTNIMETIPPNHTTISIPNWEKTYNTEWSWRFLKFDDRFVTEISHKQKNEDRKYFNKFGEWVTIQHDPSYDKYVTEQYYVYT